MIWISDLIAKVDLVVGTTESNLGDKPVEGGEGSITLDITSNSDSTEEISIGLNPYLIFPATEESFSVISTDFPAILTL